MSLINDIATYLTAQGEIGTMGWEGFKYFMPDSPDKAVAIFTTGGREPEKGFDLRYPTFQIRVRGEASAAGTQDAVDKLESIRNTLHSVTDATLGTTSYAYIIAQSEMLSLGRDQNDRNEYTINFRTAINL